MGQPVDLTGLREMTDGDVELEQSLFDEFCHSFESGLEGLRNNCGESETETWRRAAHALKGISLNLGAARLGDFCKDAQDKALAGAADKREMLKAMEQEYELVRLFLRAAIVV